MIQRLSKLLMLVIISALFVSSCVRIKEAVYLLPEGYTGAVVILFEQPDGIVLPIENGYHVYKIPSDGILRVKSSPILKVSDEKFFYEKANGERIQIEYLYPTGRGRNSPNARTFDQIKPGDKTIFVMGREVGTFFKGANKLTRFRSFKIGSAFDSEKLYLQTRNKINELNF